MFRNILVPLDRSSLAEEAVQTAITFAKSLNARLTLLNVLEILPILQKDKDAEYKALRAKGEEYLAGIRKEIEKNDISVEIVFEAGDPSLVICKCAQRQDVDLVVMSSHGRGGVERWALGSVSDKVLRHSPKPVLLVRSASRDVLRGRTILLVDDEPDVLDSIAEELDMCVLYKATTHDSALEYIENNRYDIVVLDIMGVDGFDLLKHTVSRGIPTVMLTAHSMTSEALSKSAKLGAVSFVPKEKIPELKNILIDVIQSSGRPVWKKLFDRFSPYFRRSFGWSAVEEKDISEKFEQILKEDV